MLIWQGNPGDRDETAVLLKASVDREANAKGIIVIELKDLA